MPVAETLSITLPADMVRAIRAKVESGGYSSNSEVIRAWLDRQRHFATLEAAIDRGIADIEAGRFETTDVARDAILKRLGAGDAKTFP